MTAFALYVSADNISLLWKLVTKPVSIKVIVWMATVLTFGLPFIYSITDIKNPSSIFYNLNNLTIRKLFHFIAFVCFTPPHAMMLENKEVFRLLVFAFNCVTVLFIFLEFIRFTHQGTKVGDYFNSMFGRFSDSREQMN